MKIKLFESAKTESPTPVSELAGILARIDEANAEIARIEGIKTTDAADLERILKV